MTAYFFDSSALVKRYVPETGTDWVQAIATPDTGNLLSIAQITWVEVLSALARRQREGSLPARNISEIIQEFRTDLDTHARVT